MTDTQFLMDFDISCMTCGVEVRHHIKLQSLKKMFYYYVTFVFHSELQAACLWDLL